MKKHKSYNYKFTELTHSRKGISGLVLALLSLGGGIILVVVSFLSAGNGSVYLGSAGVLAFLVALIAFGLAMASLREEDKYRIFPVLALIVSLMAVAAWGSMYVYGALEVWI